MAEEPAPSSPPPADQTTSTSESSRAAAALSAMSSHSAQDSAQDPSQLDGSSSSRHGAASKGNTAQDETAALGRAVEGLRVGEGPGAGDAGKKAAVVKVDAGDVAFLVSQSISRLRHGDVYEGEDWKRLT